MKRVQHQKKKQLVGYIAAILTDLKLPYTADVLKKEARIDERIDVQTAVSSIIADNALTQNQKQAELQTYFQFVMKKYVRERKFNEALEIYQNYIPIHIPNKLQEYSFFFAEKTEDKKHQIQLILQNYISETLDLPQRRASYLCIQKEIWFIKPFNNEILVVDHVSNFYVVNNNHQIRIKRQKLHNDRLYVVTVGKFKDKQVVASGGTDKVVKIWNHELDLIHKIDYHKTRINTLCFVDSIIVAFDNNKYLSITNLIVEPRPIIGCLIKTEQNFYDTKYLPLKRIILGVTFEKNKGQINTINIHDKKIEKIIETSDRIYSIQISLNEKLVFANLISSEIKAFSISKKELRYTFSGFVQKSNLMRMSIGGKNGKFLAVTSQDGSVCIFNIKKQRLMLNIKGISKKCVNSTIWMGEDLIFGCDEGILECWSNKSLDFNPVGKTQPKKITEQEKILAQLNSNMIEEQNSTISNRVQIE